MSSRKKHQFAADQPTDLGMDDGAATLSLLISRLDLFIAEWESQESPPSLAEFLPIEGKVRHVALVELIKVDLEFRWRIFNFPKRLPDYLSEFPELENPETLGELLREEILARRAAGFRVTVDEYVEQFPELEYEIRHACDLGLEESKSRLQQNKVLKRIDEIQPGLMLDEFELLSELGKGAFGKVFLARQESMQRLVALKVTAAQGDEPKTLAQLDHEQIVRVYDQRLVVGTEFRLMYMQYLPGGTLHEVIDELRSHPEEDWSGKLLLAALTRALESRGESLETDASTIRFFQRARWPEIVCWIGIRLANGLHYAHERGILHRDIKPANVLLSRLGSPKLADFNISYNSQDQGTSAAAFFGGSLAYMSPEQLEAFHPGCDRTPQDLDERSDLYSLGVLLWELLRAERPFPCDRLTSNLPETLVTMIKARRQGLDPEQRESAEQECPPGLVRVLVRCLAPNEDDRWQSGQQLADQLDYCLDGDLQALLHPPQTSREAFWKRFPVMAVVLFAAVPNLLAGLFNLMYNRQTIVLELGTARTDVFDRLQLIINAIAYPLGLGALGHLAWTCTRYLKTDSPGDCPPHLRQRSLRLGRYAALIGVIEWIIAGIAYPVIMEVITGDLPWQASLHFWGSLVLCGLIAAAYPFFAITCLSLRTQYPFLLGDELAPPEDRPLLESLRKRSWLYLTLAVAVPLLAILVVVSMPTNSRFALLGISGASLVGLFPLIHCFQRLQSDLATFLRLHQRASDQQAG
ncbi:MAG: serine/threonine protein kinase [Planctomycetaceae bacterium]|nr:serine/threonine protein kinase [Planctomycetaceae bacterium]